MSGATVGGRCVWGRWIGGGGGGKWKKKKHIVKKEEKKGNY